MSDFLRQIGSDPQWYWLAAGGTLVLWLASAAPAGAPGGHWSRRWNPPAVFGTLLLLTMFAWRWPGIFYFRSINPDESQFLAGAITMAARGQFWWIDPTTSGPLVVWPLTLPKLFGLPIDYGTGRLVALLLTWGTVMLTYLSLRHLHGDRKARLLVLPLAALMVCLLFWDFVPYCSELSPLFFCALAVWLCLSAFQADGALTSRARLAGGGLVLGLLPYTKFQVLPLGAAVGFSALVWILQQPAADLRKIRRDFCILLAGTGTGFALPLLSLWQSGQLGNFYQSSVVHSLHYAQSRSMEWASSGYVLHYLTDLAWGFSSFHYGLLLLLGLGLWGWRQCAWRPVLLGWTLLLAAYGAVLAPGRLYPHYLLFLSLPLALLVGLHWGPLLPPAGGARRKGLALGSLFFLLGVGTQVIDRVSDRQALQKLAPTGKPWAAASGFINQTKRPGDALAVWGWRPELYVDTQLPQATREAHTDGQLQATPLRDYFRTRFLADLQVNQPAFFVDSVGPDDYGHRDPVAEGHESFPALAEHVRQEYRLVSNAAPIRVYVRRRLLEEQKPGGHP